jgi:hypothetical protein
MVPPHALDVLTGDRQAETGAAVGAGRRAVGLGEGVPQALLLVRLDADARV